MRFIYLLFPQNLLDIKFRNTYYWSSLITTQPDDVTQLTGVSQTTDILPQSLFHLLLIHPVPFFVGMLSVCLFIYFLTEYNVRFLPHEKFKLCINILYRTQTPLTLMRNQLEELICECDSLPDNFQPKLKQILEYTNHILCCNLNVIALDRMKDAAIGNFPVIELELYPYLNSVIEQCRPYANLHRVQLKVNENFDYIGWKVNESVMTAALQSLLNQIIRITPSEGCVNITASHTSGYCKLHISNCKEIRNEFKKIVSLIFALLPAYGSGSMQAVRKIIRLHGGNMTNTCQGRAVTIHIVVPVAYHRLKQKSPETKVFYDEKPRSNSMGPMGKTNRLPHVVLIMSDKKFRDYLDNTLSESFQVSMFEDPEQTYSFLAHRNPDAIVVDERVNGIHGKELCARLRADRATADIPILLLVNSDDNESYLSYLESGVDRLELRTNNVHKIKMDINMLINCHKVWHERVKHLLAGTSSSILPPEGVKEDADMTFMNKVHELLDQNLTKEGYTIDILCREVGMCRTSFSERIKMITGKSPKDYILSFKMDKASKLLASGQYNVAEIAIMLGFCDAKYFGKKFKDFYQVCPTKYIEDIAWYKKYGNHSAI